MVRADDQRWHKLGGCAPDLRPGQNDQTIGNQIVVLPNGTLVNIFDEIHNDNSKKQRGFSVRVVRSTNKGGTWSDAILIDQLRTIGVADPGLAIPCGPGHHPGHCRRAER